MDLSTLFGPDGALTRLFAANTSAGGQPAGQPNPPQPAAAAQPTASALPTAPPATYAEFIKNLADAAVANIHEKTWTQRGLLTAANGDDLTAARANVIAGAPQVYDAYQAGHTGVQSGQLDLGQNLAYINNWRLAHGQPAVDLNNIPGTFNGTAPAARPSLSPSTGVVAPPGPQADGAVGANPSALFGRLADAMPTMLDTASSPFATSMQPPISVAPLAAPSQANAAPSNVPAILRAANAMPQGMPMAPPPMAPQLPTAPQSPSPANPLDAQRAFFASQAASMGGLPKFAGQLPEINKIINQGVGEGRAVNYGTGAVSDINTGLPVTADVNADAATKASGIKTAEVPALNAAEAYKAQQQRLTDSAHIRGEFGAKLGETDNEKAQDFITGYNNSTGEIGQVSKHDLATGAVRNFTPGAQPYLEKHSKELEAANDTGQKAAQGIIQAQALVKAAEGLTTGAWGDTVQDWRRGLAQLGLGSVSVRDNATKGDVLNELGTELAGMRARDVTGGRLPMSTFNVFRSVKAGLMSTDPAAVAAPVISSFQRQLDYAEFTNRYYSDPRNWNKLDAPTAFRAANPDQKYIDAAAPAASSGAIAQPQNADDFKALPKGTRYTKAGDPAGHYRVKQ